MKLFLAGLLICISALLPVAAQVAVRLEGQVVCCAECWAEADRNKVEYGTAGDLLKAKACVEGGDPTLLAVKEGDRFTLFQLAEGKYRLPGRNWLEFVGKRVAVTGAVQIKRNSRIIKVHTFEVQAQSPAERDAANVIGREIDLKLKDLSGVEQSLNLLKGRIVILNFWATYCIPCKAEMPELAAIQNEYAALGVQVIGASADETESRAQVLRFIKETRINFPVWMGATAADMMRFGLGSALPGTVVIGSDGGVARVFSGVVNQTELKKQLDAMLTAAEAERMSESEVASAGKRSNDVSSVPS